MNTIWQLTYEKQIWVLFHVVISWWNIIVLRYSPNPTPFFSLKALQSIYRAHNMFSWIFQIRIYQFFPPNLTKFVLISSYAQNRESIDLFMASKKRNHEFSNSRIWSAAKCLLKPFILLTSSNNQISKFRIPNIYNEIFVLIFLMILTTHFEASLRFRKN